MPRRVGAPLDGTIVRCDARVVVFTKTMSLPSVIERLLGSGTSMATLRFEETQTFAWDPATSTACVRSTPTLVSPRSESFQTEVAVYVCPDGDDPTRRCAMRAVIKVTASGTWALQPVVEKLMETRASASFREWSGSRTRSSRRTTAGRTSETGRCPS